MVCKICGKEFDKPNNMFPEANVDLDKKEICSWVCYMEDCKKQYEEVTEFLRVEMERQASKVKPTTSSEWTEKDLKKREKMMKEARKKYAEKLKKEEEGAKKTRTPKTIKVAKPAKKKKKN